MRRWLATLWRSNRLWGKAPPRSFGFRCGRKLLLSGVHPTMPSDLAWRHIIWTGFLAGIGFTMSLFIEGLAFGKTPLDAPAKVGILAVSGMAGLIGWLFLKRIRQT